jgi:hypothetical protein
MTVGGQKESSLTMGASAKLVQILLDLQGVFPQMTWPLVIILAVNVHQLPVTIIHHSSTYIKLVVSIVVDQLDKIEH